MDTEHGFAPLDPVAYENWLDQVVYLPEAAMLRKVSVDTLKRLGKAGKIKIIELSERRREITRREALCPLALQIGR